MEGVSASFPLLIRGGLQPSQHPEPVPVNPQLVAGYRQDRPGQHQPNQHCAGADRRQGKGLWDEAIRVANQGGTTI